MRRSPVVHALIVCMLAAVACGRVVEEPEHTPAVAANERLADHSVEFERGVVRVTDGVYVAIGYGLANSILLEGDDGVVIVDTMESAEAAAEVRDAFREITKKPVRAIVYTHNHADHIFGAGVLAGDDEPEVYAHATTVEYVNRVINVVRPIIFTRSMRQFGTYLPDNERINCGIGPRLVNDATTTISYLPPTKTFAGDRMDVEVAGIRLRLVHAPGETPDQIFVWLPDKRVLLPGDNYYKSFPNLYAIRGTPYRDVMQWVESLDKMRALRPAFLVPSHTRPVTGEETIAQVLTDYRDAIQYVHDQTIRAINEGKTRDEIAAALRLPEHLAEKPYLQEFYGRVDWSVRAIFDGYLGWFDGNAADLRPFSPLDRAKRMADLAGGPAALLQAARQAWIDGDAQWALELADVLIRLGLKPFVDEARAIRVDALRALAAEEISANGRNYLLTQALETEGAIEIEPPPTSNAPDNLLRSFPVGNFLRAMAVRLDAEAAADTNTVVGFRFPDTGEAYTLHVRRGVAEVQPRFPDKPDITVTVDSLVWKEVLARKRNIAAAVASGDVAVEGGRIRFVRLLALFA